MNVAEFTQDVEIIKKLGTYPNEGEDGLSEDQLKERFDQAAKYIKEYLNETVVPALNSTLTAEEILEKISSGGDRDIDLLGRMLRAGTVIVAPATNPGFYATSALEDEDPDRPVALLGGTNDEGLKVIVRNVADGTSQSDAVNKGQLDKVGDIAGVLLVTVENGIASMTGEEIFEAVKKGKIVQLAYNNRRYPLISVAFRVESLNGSTEAVAEFSGSDYGNISIDRYVVNGVGEITERREELSTKHQADRTSERVTNVENRVNVLGSDVSRVSADVGSVSLRVDGIISEDIKIDSTFSSNTIVDKFAPRIDEIGKLIQCYPFPGYPLYVFPLVENRADVKVTLCGKNLYDKNSYPMIANQMIRQGSGVFATSSAFSATEKFIPAAHLRGKTIAIRNAPSTTSGTGSSTAGIAFYEEADEKTYISGTDKSTIKVPDNACYLRFSTATNIVNEAQVEIGGESTAYEAYKEADVDYTDGAFKASPLSGINTVFAYDGESVVRNNVVGRADPLIEIQVLKDAIVSLGGNI